MQHDDFQKQLAALKAKIKTLPVDDQSRMRAMVSKTQARRSELATAIDSMQDTIQRLSLATKYMAFDLEATKRENQAMRDLLKKYGIDEGGELAL